MAKKSTAQKARDKAAKTRKAIINKPGPPTPAQKARIDRLEETMRTAGIVIKSEREAAKIVREADSPEEALQQLRAERDADMRRRGVALVDPTRKGKQFQEGGAFDSGLAAQAMGDAMRAITGRQMGQGTPYTGPGATVVQDDEGNIVRGPQGRVQYQIDPEAYARRFRPQFTPTEEQLAMGLNIQPGLLTPYQQTNFQWLLGGEGLAPTAGGRIPTDFRQDWRTEQWGDVYDKKTGLWKRADPDKRQAAVAEQLRRYEAGEFNPTVGSVAGDRWTGKGVGVASADQWLPKGWTPPAGSRAAVGAGIQQGAYRRPAPLDWSAIMPTDTPLASQQALVAGKGKLYQPWATRQATPRGLINYQVPGGAGFDVTYSGANPSLFDFNQDTTTTTNGSGTTTVTAPGEPAGWSHPDYATFMGYTQAMHALNQAHDPASASFVDWEQ